MPQKSLLVDNLKVNKIDVFDGTVKRTHALGSNCPILSKVVEKWESLSVDTKNAIKAIVEFN